MSDKRHFTVVEGKKEHGLFVGRNPSSVARKVVSKLSKGGKKVVFELREITQGSKKKVYGPYEGQKKKLKEPRKVGDRVYKYESVVKKIEKKGGADNWEEEISLEFDYNGSKVYLIKKRVTGINKYVQGREATYRLKTDGVETTPLPLKRFAHDVIRILPKDAIVLIESKLSNKITYNNKYKSSWKELADEVRKIQDHGELIKEVDGFRIVQGKDERYLERLGDKFRIVDPVDIGGTKYYQPYTTQYTGPLGDYIKAINEKLESRPDFVDLDTFVRKYENDIVKNYNKNERSFSGYYNGYSKNRPAVKKFKNAIQGKLEEVLKQRQQGL